MKLTPSLQPGDIVDIVAPAWAVPQKDISAAVRYLKNLGFLPRLPAGLIKPSVFHSNSDAERFRHLRKALFARDSKAIWCLRGGYGSNRLLPFLSKLKKPKQKKILIGLSDITSLHLFLNQEWKWSTLHAPVLDRMAKGGFAKSYEKELLALLSGATIDLSYALKPLNLKAKKVSKLSGKIVGGNLTVLQSSLGTPFQIHTKGKFLFIEDVGERGYRIDRMLEQFRQAGLYKNCKALLVGPILGGEEPGSKLSHGQAAIQRFADQQILPVFSGVPSGHGEFQRVLPFYQPARLEKKKGKTRLIL